jgi:hypothetical protein
LVGFFGFGGGAGAGFGFGHVGWVPLAPYEPFHPWWGRGIYGGYRHGAVLNNSFITHNVNISNVYRNARFENAVTGMHSSQFGRAGVGVGAFTRVSRGDLQSAGLVRGQLPVAPDRASLNATDRNPRVGLSGSTGGNGRFFQTRQPSTVNRVPFEQQRTQTQQAFHSSSGMNGNAGGWRQATPSSPSVQPRVSTQPPASAGVGGGGGWRRFEPGGTSNAGPSVRGSYPTGGQGSYPTGAQGSYPNRSSGNYPGAIERQPMRMNPSIVQPRPVQPSYQPPSRPAVYSQPQPAYRQPSSPPPSGGGSRPSSGPPSGSGHGGGGGHSSGRGR